MRRVVLRTGLELAVREAGDGEPVLLLHAWGETHRVFDRLVALMPPTLRLVVPDQRGVGDSAKPADGYGVPDAAADMIALLDALGIRRCWLVGTSSGGYTAQHIAAQHPDRVLGLVLIGSPSDLQGRVPGTLVDLVAAFHDPVALEDVQAVNSAIPFHGHVDASFVEDQTRAALTIPKHVWLTVLQGLDAAPPPARAARITAPTLILWGADDDVLPAEQAADLARAIPGSRVVAYERTGHLVLWEQAERVAADMASFIAAVARDRE